MQNPTSDAHSNTYSINANFEGISHASTPKSHASHRALTIFIHFPTKIAITCGMHQYPVQSLSLASVVCTHHHVALEVQRPRPAELHRRVTDAHHRGSGDQTRSHGTSCLTGGEALKHGKTPGTFGSIECLA